MLMVSNQTNSAAMLSGRSYGSGRLSGVAGPAIRAPVVMVHIRNVPALTLRARAGAQVTAAYPPGSDRDTRKP